MKYYLLAAALTIFSAANAQVKVTQGGNSPQFMLTNQPDVSYFSTDAADMIILHRVENFDHINTMIVTDKTGNITLSKDVRVNMGTFNNNFEVRALLVVNNKPYAFVENHSKDALKNSLEARAVDNAGNVAQLAISSLLKCLTPAIGMPL